MVAATIATARVAALALPRGGHRRLPAPAWKGLGALLLCYNEFPGYAGAYKIEHEGRVVRWWGRNDMPMAADYVHTATKGHAQAQPWELHY